MRLKCSRGYLGNQKGLTLLEVLMSLFILSVGTVFIFQTFAKVSQAQNVVETRSDNLLFLMTKFAEMESGLLTNPVEVKSGKGSFKNKFDQYYDWTIELAEYDPELGLGSEILAIKPRGQSKDESAVMNLLYAVSYENSSS